MTKGKLLAFSAITVTLATFLGRIFGFVREMAIANKFGASAQTDAFLVSFTIPNILYSLVVMGALSASFIPIYTGLLANDKEKEAWHLASTVFNLLMIIFGATMLLLVIFAPQTVLAVAPGFKNEQVKLAASLLQIMAPALLLLGISGLMSGILNSYNHFAAPSFVSLVQNILMVGSIFLLAGRFGIFAAAVGLLLGSLGQVLIQIPVFIKRKIPLKPSFSLKDSNLASVYKLFIPVLIASAASQSNLIIDKLMASFLAEGSISYLNYAFKVASLPVGTLIAAIAIVLFPTLSAQASQEDYFGLRNSVSVGIRMVALVAIPASAGLIVLSKPIVKLLFEHGAFTSSATALTAPALTAYSIGLFSMGLNMLLVRAFYALKDGVLPLKASIVFVISLIIFDLVLIRLLSHVGLALGYVLAVSLMLAMLIRGLSIKLGGIEGKKIMISCAKIILCSILMGLSAFYSYEIIASTLAVSSTVNEALNVMASIFIGIIVYVVSAFVLKVDEISLVLQSIMSRFLKARKQSI